MSGERFIKTKPLGVVTADDEWDDDEVLLVRKTDFEWLVDRNRELRARVSLTEGPDQ